MGHIQWRQLTRMGQFQCQNCKKKCHKESMLSIVSNSIVCMCVRTCADYVPLEEEWVGGGLRMCNHYKNQVWYPFLIISCLNIITRPIKCKHDITHANRFTNHKLKKSKRGNKCINESK